MSFAEIVRTFGEAVGSAASVRSVYGEPVTSGERTVIPVAKVRCAFGGGGGSHKEADAPPRGGGGGGGRITVQPCGLVEITPQGTRFVHFRDPGTLAIAVAAGFLMGLAWSALKRSKH